MKHIINIEVFILLFGVVVFISCKKTEPDILRSPPVAVAGDDQAINLPKDSIILDGSHSFEYKGSIKTYQWTTLTGPNMPTLIDASHPITIAKKLALGIYQFELRIWDDAGITTADTINIRVFDTIRNDIGIHDTTGNVKAALMEYGSGIPLAGAKIAIKAYQSSTKFQDLQLISDSKGLFSFKAYKFIITNIDLGNYWGNSPYSYPLTIFPSGPALNFNDGFYATQCDSFALSLFPKTEVAVHVRDSSGKFSSYPYLSFYAYGIWDNKGIGQEASMGIEIFLHAGIDTTFNYTFNGNINNDILIIASNENGDYEMIDLLRFVAKGSNGTINFNF